MELLIPQIWCPQGKSDTHEKHAPTYQPATNHTPRLCKVYTNRARAHLPVKQRLFVDILNRSDSYVLCGKSAHSQWPFAWPTQGLCLSESPLQIWLWYSWITLLYHLCLNTQHVPKFKNGHFWCKKNMKSPALGSIALKYWRQLYEWTFNFDAYVVTWIG